YDGWSAVVYFSEEVKQPSRNIPRAMFGGAFAVMTIYLLLNIPFLRVVPLPTLGGQKLAAAVVAQHLFGMYGDSVLRSLTMLALIASVAFLLGAAISDTRNSMYALVVLAISFPVYLLIKRKRA